MSEGKKIGYKKGETHPSADDEPPTANLPKKSGWLKNIEPPSNFLQHINIYFTVFFSLVSASLAYLTYTSQTEIKGMKEVLSTFRPNVRWVPSKMAVGGDSVLVSGYDKNYGTRTATDIVSYTYFMDSTGGYPKPNDTLIEILPNENYYWEFHFNRSNVPDSAATHFILVTKVVFTDPITNEKDSTYSVSTNRSTKFASMKFYIGKKEDEATAKRWIKERYGIDF